MTNQKDFETIIVTFPNGKKIETEVADTPEKSSLVWPFGRDCRRTPGCCISLKIRIAIGWGRKHSKYRWI